jgi:hypothetical protein
MPAAALLLILLSACSTQLRKSSDTETGYLLALRAEYLATNPDGEYNEYIKRGEVTPGMDFLEVLAAWGHPSMRSKRTYITELWTYRDIDEDSKDWIEYTFTFRRNVLRDWAIARHVAAGGILPPEGITTDTFNKGTLTRGKQVPKRF